jgi:hypothetical protein
MDVAVPTSPCRRPDRSRERLSVGIVRAWRGLPLRPRPLATTAANTRAAGCSRSAPSRCAARSDEMPAARGKGVSTLVACGARGTARAGARRESPSQSPTLIEHELRGAMAIASGSPAERRCSVQGQRRALVVQRAGVSRETEFAARSGVRRAVSGRRPPHGETSSGCGRSAICAAVDDAGVFELGEDAEDLQHHPSGRPSRCKGLGRQLRDDLELPSSSAGLALRHLPVERVYAVDEQQIEPAFRRAERLPAALVDQA